MSSDRVIWVPITWSWLSKEYWVPHDWVPDCEYHIVDVGFWYWLVGVS